MSGNLQLRTFLNPSSQQLHEPMNEALVELLEKL